MAAHAYSGEACWARDSSWVPLSNNIPIPSGPTQVNSCQRVGNRLINFSLRDLNGQPWEYRNHWGRLVLLDFWFTSCPHCQIAIRNHLVDLHNTYGRSGLEIIGIAYQPEPTFQEQVQAVDAIRRQLGICYRLLMGSGDKCPVKVSFDVHQFPTLVLIDENSRIIWRSEGLDSEGRDKLERILRSHFVPQR